ncbi:2-dehydro-3-deoxy-6-phosphogalactonate aldolase [Serratia sp. MYb239]|uniref:2-dehydro-3-deoxy-6-phosphogalactonate aldolase n=1 Tax=Serratia sp. MYb239 TaxID=2033438 RepID=UPI000CF72916|nr:2-dehydro-3-deoxy-6-phosphogalactonate aldolase [Serratia sp. MYb239]AVJ18464.1 2-dehydro-3-deoxy-6-phosphogalactonate aldolase [Serratia sp. MYb239]
MKMHLTLPLVAILRGITPDEVDDHIPVLIEAGFEAIEIPLNSPAWQTSIAHAAQRYGGQALIGAGTVVNVADVDQLAAVGCQFIVTPATQPAVIRRALHHAMPALPGCATPTEAFSAIEAGARQIKLFPAGQFGPGYVRALKSVLPADIALYAVGGVTPDTLGAYLQAGCSGAGLGNDLYRAGQTPARTAAQAQAFAAAYRSHANQNA